MESKIYSVAKLNEEIKLLLEGDFIFAGIMVQGEVTSLTKHYTGHYYFKLRDKDGSTLSCVMFNYYAKMYPNLKNGDEIIVTGSINVYEKGGTYSLNVRKIEQSGLGKYLLELKVLENRLKSEGYFDLEKKKLPYFPKKIAILTASTGAAICDVVTTIQNRCNTGIYIYPCAVQGHDASKTIVKALELAFNDNPDVIIITRGGGSKDDLYAFNDEELVIKIATSEIPIITAVGHSIDTSLVDKVSTLSCITPTDAANAVIQRKEDYLLRINIALDNIKKETLKVLDNYENKLINLTRILELSSPLEKRKMLKEKLDNLNTKLDALIKTRLYQEDERLKNLSIRSSLKKDIIKPYINDLNFLKEKLNNNMVKIMSYKNQAYLVLNTKLNALNPLNMLSKGYSLTYNAKNEIVTSIDDILINEELKLELKDGIIYTSVKNKEKRK